jgi:hypothetical protein
MSLEFTRAGGLALAMLLFGIGASAVPPADPRVAVYHSTATLLAQISIRAMYDASYEGTHWIATYIVDYLGSGRARRVGS